MIPAASMNIHRRRQHARRFWATIGCFADFVTSWRRRYRLVTAARFVAAVSLTPVSFASIEHLATRGHAALNCRFELFPASRSAFSVTAHTPICDASSLPFIIYPIPRIDRPPIGAH